MASLARFLEAGAFGVLNDILSTFHSDEGYAIPNRFEVLILSPPKRGGGITTNHCWFRKRFRCSSSFFAL